MNATHFANPLLQPSARPQPRRIAVIGAGAIGPDIAYYLNAAVPAAHGDADRHPPGGDRRGADAAAPSMPTRRLRAASWPRLPPQGVMADLHGSTDYDALAELRLGARGCHRETSRSSSRIFADVEARVGAAAAITSNTSSLPAARIFADLAHPERATVTHFFAPAWRNPAVEVIAWARSDPALVAWLRRFFCATGKLPLVTADAPCFMLDRVFDNWCNEAALLLDVATAAEIDTVADRVRARGTVLRA